MNNTYKPPPIQYVNHILNSSPSKSAYSFTRQIRFKTDISPNNKDGNKDSNASPIYKPATSQQNTYKQQTTDLTQTNKSKSKQQVKKDQTQQKKDDYFGYENKTKKKKDQYTIFPVRRDIDHIIKQMQELRFIFKTGFKQKKFLNSQRKQVSTQNKLDSFKAYKAQITVQRSRSALETDRFGSRKSDAKANEKLYNSNVSDLQNRRRSISPFSNYVQSHFRNSSSFSFTTSPRNLLDLKNNQIERKFDFYTPFSQFGPVRRRPSQV